MSIEIKNLSLLKTILLLAMAGLFLNGCAEAELAAHVAKNAGRGKTQIGDYKVGSSYMIQGKRYYPREQFSGSETGIASWYGPNFHGKQTANGEIFDQNALTAAHRTLQMPSIIRVTNLDNGRSLILRVNDRGPYSRGRVLDVSRRGAELLGYKNKGTARVKIDVLGPESRRVAEMAKSGMDTSGVEIALNRGQSIGQAVMASATQAGTVPGGDDIVKKLAPVATALFVQAGSFSVYSNAVRLSQKLQSLGSAGIYEAVVNGKTFYRVRVGPLTDVTRADSILAMLTAQNNEQAIIVVE